MRSVSTETLLAINILLFVTPILSLPVQNTDGANIAQQVSEISDEVKQLESLKNSGAQNVAVVKTESKSISNVNGKEKSITHKEEKVENVKTGQVIADVKQEIIQSNQGKPETVIKTKVDIPAEGVHKTIVNENGKTIAVENSDQTEEIQERPNQMEYYTGNDGIKYSPWDVADYIFRTGDKKALGLALRQLINEGLMSKVEAEAYMEEINMDLDLLAARSEQEARQNAWQILSQVQEAEQAMAAQDAFEAVAAAAANAQSIESLDRSNDDNKVQGHNELGGRMLIDKKSSHHPTEPDESLSVESLEDLSFLGDVTDFDSFLEKLKIADYLGRYYSVKPDDIIYELSKAMFQQSLTEGSEEATQALRKFTKFLEREVGDKRLSEALEERVLDIMTEALHDTLYENPQIQVFERLMDQQGQQVEGGEAVNQGRISQNKVSAHEQPLIPKNKLMKLASKASKTKAEKENEIVKPSLENPKPNPEATQALAHEAEKQEVVTSKKAV